ncbi:unnamed protein product [Mytilus coruscus]|uniref:C2H2-type domain-containing protein n=1 Tax=Mytilus coruscus TaxID=42192 RepID=A0A6J8CDN3_MYTCO|nr:unnamed protein product [Mytilus coruscus]
MNNVKCQDTTFSEKIARVRVVGGDLLVYVKDSIAVKNRSDLSINTLETLEVTDDSLDLPVNSEVFDMITPFNSQSSSQISSWSQENDIHFLSSINKAMDILGHGKISPIKFQIRTNIEDLKPSTLRYLKRKATTTVHEALDCIAPSQAKKLLQLLHIDKEPSSRTKLSNTEDIKLQQLIIQLYNESSDRNAKIQLLSMVSDLSSKKALQDLMPWISQYAVDTARQHAVKHGKGVPLPNKEKFTRQRIDKGKLDHALDFFFDPTFHQVSSFGTKELKLSSGEVLQIPEVVRTACHSSIVDTYMSYCKETEFEPLSRATLFNILSECPASHRTNLKGLDNIAADGVCAMDTLLEIVANFQNSTVHQNTNFSDMKEKLISYKLYLKTDFKHHVQMKDQCSDHCIQFALSDPTEKKLARSCTDHLHDMKCPRCCLLPDTVIELKRIISEFTEERTEFLVDIETAEGKVLDWKSHILRCVNQDRCRLETLQNLTEGDAMIVMDWAMKFLPLRHREKQSDFFGQKGFNWHVTVVIFKDIDDLTLKHRTYVHTIESAKQDWYSITSVIEHTLKTIKDQMPNIKSVVLRSDNAGCYHCSNLRHSLHGISQRTGVYIKEYDFSEAQNGKSYCDSKIAHMRGKMRKYVLEGGDIRSSTEMKEALDVYGGVSGCQISNVTIDTESQTKDQSQLKGITKYSNVKIDHDGRLTCWKAFGIGEGQCITMSSFNQEDTNLNVLEDFSLPKHIEGSIKNSNSIVNDQVPREGDLYCPEMTCSRKFKSYSELEDHCFVGDHALCPTHDLIKLQWKGVCLDISSCSVKTREGSLQNGDSTLQSGWGLKKDRKSVRFSLKTKNYLKEIFDSGEKNGQKANASNVAKNMRISRDNTGKKIFSPHEYLQPSQIVSYFSRLALLLKCPSKKDCEVSDEDLESAIALINRSEALEELL